MKSVAVAAVLALMLTLPVGASAKTGLTFDTYPETAKVGEPIPFTMTVWGDSKAVAGIRPLVTFTSATGRVVRVRTRRTDRYGVAHGLVAFPEKGTWTPTYDIRLDGVDIGEEGSQPIHVATGLTQTIPSLDQTRAAAKRTEPGAGFPRLWVLSLGSIGTALIVLAMRRRRRWGAA